MADVDSSSAAVGETPNQKQARLRREKRQQKMAEEGEDRLARIKALNGGVAPPAEVLGGPATPHQNTTSNQASVEDPDEADIDTIQDLSRGSTQPARTNAQDNPLKAAMLQMQQQQVNPKSQAGAEGAEEDAMVKMMQQLTGMLGGNPQNPNDPNQPPQIPAALQAMMAGTKAKEQKAPETGSAYLWRILHAVFAFTLATYITMTSTFNGSKLARTQSVYSEDSYGFGSRLFVAFTTAELLLQGTRYFVEKGQLRGNGWLATIANSGMVPEPYAQYIRTAGRYVGIAQTIFSDVMVIIFVFGALAWWRGMATA